MNRSLSTLVASLALAWGCVSPLAAQTEAPSPAPTSPAPADAAQTDDAAETHALNLPIQSLTPEILYTMILGEIAGARGQIGVAVDAYVQLVRQTGDPRIAKRATEVALFARNMQAAAETVRVWADGDPESEDARRILAGILASGGERLNEVQLQLARILAESPDQLEQNLLGLNRALAGLPNKHTSRAIIERLTAPYAEEPAAQFARAQAAVAVEDGPGALNAIDRALSLRPTWEPAVLFKSQLLMQLDLPDDAINQLETYLATRPDSLNARLSYARILASQHRLVESREEFQHLLDTSPDDRDLMYAVALLSAQLNDFDTAVPLFERALRAGHPEADGIRFNLGQIAEQRDDLDGAINWYREVEPGAHYLDAQTRIALALANQGKIEEARIQLRGATVDEADQKRLLLLETLLLRNADRIDEAYAMIDEALRHAPDDGELLYESAMLAERLGQLDVMEGRLRKVIALYPDHAHAYNALGYTLADRSTRLDEAEALVAQALELAPDDPFILDSMGWVRFRRGETQSAADLLQRAYDIQPDPEIAAHLGEVLWALQRRDDANEIWDEALRAHPDHQPLQDTVKRLRGQ